MSSEQAVALSPLVLHSPFHWRKLDFISDLHLQETEIATFLAWQNFMQSTPADAIFILGDLFEVWIGDDAIGTDARYSFEARCVQVLKSASQRLKIFLIHGNRDFLLGQVFSNISGVTLLADPSILEFAGTRWLLSHGDSLCLGDTEYLQFRKQVRSPVWQQNFLAKPLVEREAIARAMRDQSELRKQSDSKYADVDESMARHWLATSNATTLIHGHTHKPADHDLNRHRNTDLTGESNKPQQSLRRIVLSDWDASATPSRTEVLRLEVAHPPRRIKI
jgi:UDP-2,3-diacylglucosamine hydrolase